MERISSSATLMLKFFIPTFWIVFFSAFTVAMFAAPGDTHGASTIQTLRIVAVSLLLVGALIMWRTVLSLKRMEMDDDYLYVTNYFKTFRYPFSSIASMKVKDRSFFKTLTVDFKEEGTFGKRAKCVLSEKLFKDFMENHTKIAFQFGFRPED